MPRAPRTRYLAAALRKPCHYQELQDMLGSLLARPVPVFVPKLPA